MKRLFVILPAIVALSFMVSGPALPAGAQTAAGGRTFRVAGTVEAYLPGPPPDGTTGDSMSAVLEEWRVAFDGNMDGGASDKCHIWHDLLTGEMHGLGLLEFKGSVGAREGRFIARSERLGVTGDGPGGGPAHVSGSSKAVLKIVGGSGGLTGLRGSVYIALATAGDRRGDSGGGVVWTGTYKGWLTFAANDSPDDGDGRHATVLQVTWSEWRDWQQVWIPTDMGSLPFVPVGEPDPYEGYDYLMAVYYGEGGTKE